MAEEFDWSDDLPVENDEAPAAPEYVDGPDSPAADLGEADRRIAANEARSAEVRAFEAELARIKHPPAESDGAEETPLTLRLGSIPVGDPAWRQLADELLAVARDRAEAAKAKAEAAAVAATPVDEGLDFDARDLTSQDFAAFAAGALQPPAGSLLTPRAWRELRVKASGV